MKNSTTNNHKLFTLWDTEVSQKNTPCNQLFKRYLTLILYRIHVKYRKIAIIKLVEFDGIKISNHEKK